MTNNNHIRDPVIHFFALACRLAFTHAKTYNNQEIIRTAVINVPTKNVAERMIS